ncbi:MobA/MobL family protein [Methylobacterium sp. 092160098-2]|uniref:MobA/MobL family protein n=1 Tax=Methylobacterium sp. 092160098-2 TaxID=3025129 RepID=UPI00406C5BBD
MVAGRPRIPWEEGYRAGERLHDEQTGAEHDFSRRKGVVHTEIMLPEGAAPWVADRQRLWNHLHQIEARRDAQLAREINLALPHELTGDERLARRRFL